MKIRLPALLFFHTACCFMQLAWAQNLVPNPSFEIFDTCPNGSSQIYRATGWLPFTSSPDYFNECWFKTQCPNTGKGMARIGCYLNPKEYNEVIATELVSPLTQGNKYYVSFRVKLQQGAELGIDKIGAIFTTKKYCNLLNPFTNICDSTPMPINNWAHIISSQIITDTINWVTIYGSFTADSQYKYIAIGHFFDRLLTDTIKLYNSFTQIPFYYIDDVCVSQDSLTCLDIKQEIIDFIGDTTTIPKGICVNFTLNTVVDYDFYEWQFSGASPNSSAESNPANICYDSAGIFDVILIASDSSGCADTVIKNNYITVVDTNVSVNQNANLQQLFNMYPNPTVGKISIKGRNIIKEIQIEIYNALGKLLIYRKINYPANNEIDLSEISPGIYFLKLEVNNQIINKKIIINP